MPIPRDIAGQRFGRLTALSRLERKIGRISVWLCRCDCGTETEVAINNLTTNHSKSCGCLSREYLIERNKTVLSSHKKTNTRVYRIWHNMKNRCAYSSVGSYAAYGARGIKVCQTWSQSFEAFYRDMGDPPSELHSLGRVDVNKDYGPDNCVWIETYKQQWNRQDSHLISWNGITKSLPAWAHALGVNQNSLRSRLRNGWTAEEALSLPFRV